ncbi:MULTISPECIES: hypothetical protein [unclassified Gilliamella]|uniref:hypothetical protein n=1 Tax=unclassified Gilliamella TaxID=2685620 RepID=UPI00130C20EA|nr:MULTISPECIES: hypothetical protein [unclassified Gilliamella]MWP49967.1 hypothetical protein [Gilliamella sp. Lep-s35]MWP69648.1 hypothetical protein [Gilliamella sp. Lep-s5]MWP77991.1 hypothetical protein [Gilliamella sp. Lep-s21]
MKNLTIKKVALGLFLAGYATSSAIALEALETTTNEVIHGNAPMIKAIGGSAPEHAMTLIVTTDADGKTPISSVKRQRVQVGDYIHITYDLVDKDGDTDTTGAMKDTLKVYKVMPDGKVSQVKVSAEDHSTSTQGHLSFKITDDFAGAKTIGYTIQEKTSYGLPDHGQFLMVSDIFSSTSPAGSDSEQTPTGDHGPGVTPEDPIIGPIISSSVHVGIFGYDDKGKLDLNKNYAKTNDIPKYGESYEAYVWAGDADKPADGVNLTGDYSTYEWNLDDTYEGVKAQDKVKGIASGLKITLADSNSDTMYQHPSVIYKAGGQGYKLKITVQ